ncbi:MAG: hypothetical protein H7281_16845 [Bacteriovorax sp.]|nr:hypothetical protein [Bacteriovorax sp.]
MKNLLITGFFLVSMNTYSWDAPEIIENACYQGCTPKMEKMYDNFQNTKSAPVFIPGMYSGECHHNSWALDPETTHYIGLLLDQDSKGTYMGPVLQFFGDSNDMKDWSLEDGRKEISGDWKKTLKVAWHPTSLTAHVEDENGNPALVYWARQNPLTKEIYFMAFMAGFSTAFCTAHPNVNGLPK